MKSPTLSMAVFLLSAVGSMYIFASVSRAAPASEAISPPGKQTPLDLSKKPAYWRDNRLLAEIHFPEAKSARPGDAVFLRRDPKLPPNDPTAAYQTVRMVGGRVLQLSEALTVAGIATGASIRAQGDWERDTIAVPRAAGPAREWMDALAQAYRGTWQRIAETWILSRTPAEARYTLLTEPERRQEDRRALTTLFMGMRPALWQRLVNGESLKYGDLELAQQSALIEVMRLYYYDASLELAPGPAALFGYPITLQYCNQGKGASVSLSAPGADGFPYSIDVPFYHPATGELLWGVLPPK